MFTLTSQQSSFIDALLTTTGNIALVARAGCGKTATILEAVDRYRSVFPQHDVLICAFGKAIEREITTKLEKRGITDWRKCQASTSHSLGFSAIKFPLKLSRNNVDDKKVIKLIEAQNDLMYREFGAQIAQLVHLAKLEGFGFFDDVQVGDARAWYLLADHYNVNSFDDTTDMDRVVTAAQTIYKLSLAQVDVIDFDDMILFPLVKNIRVKFQKDLIFVDEAQDTSRARRALIRKYLKPGGRMVVVGDDRQAIMGFAGASADALGELVRDLEATTMPLTMTWRCPKSVVAEAQAIVADIEAAPGAIDGEVLHAEEFPAEMQATDAILCRNTAPLVAQAYAMIRKGVACKVEGRDIGNGLLRIVNRWKVSSIDQFTVKLNDYCDREVQKAMAKGKDSKAQQIKDQCETLEVICNAVLDKKRTDLQGVREFIDNLFGDDVHGVLTLCTYHRSKGREWTRVFLLEHTKRCPSPWAKQDWEKLQESNLAYVAITRAQQTLVYVN